MATRVKLHGHFSAGEVGELAGVTGNTIGQWARWGYIRASQSDGEPHVYSVEDAGEIILFALGEREGQRLRIGRSPASDILLDDRSVSRRHAVVVHRNGRAVLLDDRSLNGIFVNGQRVGEAHLRDGDAIMIGHVSLRYVEVTGG